MGQCGCADFDVHKGYRLPDGKIVTYRQYGGCDYCYHGIAVDIHIFPDDRSEWLQGYEFGKFIPDENGGREEGAIDIFGLEFHQIGIDELLEALPEVEEECGKVGSGTDDYETMADWLKDNGLRWLQAAIDKRP